MDIRQIFCVGRNYADHATELKNEVPEAPIWFMKPSSSLIMPADNGFLPLDFSDGSLHYEAELVVYFQHPIMPEKPLAAQISHWGVGIDFTKRDLQTSLKQKGLPWLRAKGFPNSAALSPLIPFPGEKDFYASNFSLKINALTRQVGDPTDMLFPLQELLKDCQKNFHLTQGDLLFTGTPKGVGETLAGDLFELYLDKKKLISFTITSQNEKSSS